MNIEEARELIHKLNHGVDRADHINLRDGITTDPDGQILTVREDTKLPLGHVGSARPCCDAPGDEHTDECVTRRQGEGL